MAHALRVFLVGIMLGILGLVCMPTLVSADNTVGRPTEQPVTHPPGRGGPVDQTAHPAPLPTDSRLGSIPADPNGPPNAFPTGRQTTPSPLPTVLRSDGAPIDPNGPPAPTPPGRPPGMFLFPRDAYEATGTGDLDTQTTPNGYIGRLGG